MSYVNPVAGRISSKYGQRKHPITGKTSMHNGTDIAAASGTAVKVAAAGTVAVVSHNNLAGYFINVQHPGGILTRYHHLSAQSVKVGQKVSAGQVIGRVGMTGSATGPHLHFEVHRHGTRVDPPRFMRSQGIELGTNKPLPRPKLIDDGKWGSATTRRAQEVFGTYVDGVVSSQPNIWKKPNPGLTSGWEWVKNAAGSPLIRAIQKWLGVKQDGKFGEQSIRKFQARMGTPIDGKLWLESPAIKEFQRRLNEGNI